jgi:hypothetical protein
MLANEVGSRDMWNIAFHLSGDLNQAFALVFVVASSAAILLWSIAILRSGIFSRALGIYGCFVAPLTLIAVLSGHIRLNVHGFGIVVLSQAVWFISAGVLLWKEKQEPAQLTTAQSDHSWSASNSSFFSHKLFHSNLSTNKTGDISFL